MSRSNRTLNSLATVWLFAAAALPDCPASEPALSLPRTASVPRGKPGTHAAEPQSIDLRPAFQKWSLDPRVQGNRGTCSVFVITDALEYAVADKQGHATRLSVEFLNWAAHKATKTTEDGGFFSDLWKGYAAYGICPETEMPYRDHFDPALQPSGSALAGAKAIREPRAPTPLDQGVGSQAGFERAAIGRGQAGAPAALACLRRLPLAEARAMGEGRAADVPARSSPRRPQRASGRLSRRSRAARRRRVPHPQFLGQEPRRPVELRVPAGLHERRGVDRLPRSKCGRAASLPGQGRTSGARWRSPDIAFRDPLGALVAPPTGRNRRISSNEQPNWNNGNMDMTWLQPGEVLEMPLLKGPGVITHIWFTSHAGWANELNALSIRIYWDGRKEPGVEAPLGDFFAVGQGKPAVVESLPVQVSPTGALSCYWRMPFAKSARIVIRNDNPDRGAGLYWQVDWRELDRLPPDTGYFHARYRQEHPAVMGHDYLIADLAGRGQYVGTVMSVTLAQDGWFGEGDDFFYIDGEQVPSLQGTGSEDYFNDAWGFRPRTSHWFGQPRWQGDRTGDSGVCYRWHVLDPVGFSKSLRRGDRAQRELRGRPGRILSSNGPISSAASPSGTRPASPKPSASCRRGASARVPWQQHHMVRAFLNARTTGSAKVEVQTQGFFGSRPLLAWPNQEIAARLTVPLTVDEDGRYAVRLTAVQGPQYGRYGILIDERAVGEGDFRASEDGELDLSLGTRVLSKGTHSLTFQAIGDRTEGGPPVPSRWRSRCCGY